MRKIIYSWSLGLEYLLFDDLISYYAFFSAILTECFYLFAFHKQELAINLSMILIGYIATVLIASRLKYSKKSANFDLAVSITYLIVFSALFIIGCYVNLKLCILLTIIPLISTFMCMIFREIQDSWTIPPAKSEQLEHFVRFFCLFISYFCLFVTVVLPFILFTVFFALIPTVPISLKIIVPIVYAFLSPFIAYIEDSWAGNNIFELFIE